MGWRTQNNGIIRIRRSDPAELEAAISANKERGYELVKIIQEMSQDDLNFLQKSSDYYNRASTSKRAFKYENGSYPVQIAVMRKVGGV